MREGARFVVCARGDVRFLSEEEEEEKEKEKEEEAESLSPCCFTRERFISIRAFLLLFLLLGGGVANIFAVLWRNSLRTIGKTPPSETAHEESVVSQFTASGDSGRARFREVERLFFACEDFFQKLARRRTFFFFSQRSC